MKNYCNGDCNQGRQCDCGVPFNLDAVLWAVALVFAASCVAYLCIH